MSRSEHERFGDILRAIERCESYAPYLESEELAGMAYDAILRNLAVIGEAVRSLPAESRSQIPDVPWAAISGMRNIVIHEYFRVDRALVLDIIDSHLSPLARRLREL